VSLKFFFKQTNIFNFIVRKGREQFTVI